MTRFAIIQAYPSDKFTRIVGIRLDQFLALRDQLVASLRAEQEAHPMKKRGKKATMLSLEDKLLLTLTYVRHDPTFEQVGQQFGISTSYAHKIYQHLLDHLVKTHHLPGRKALREHGVHAVLVDVTEQPIERPTRQQRAWYSGKKTPYDQSPTHRGIVEPPHVIRHVWDWSDARLRIISTNAPPHCSLGGNLC